MDKVVGSEALAASGPGGRATQELATAAAAVASMRSLAFDRMSASMAVLDGDGVIVDTNEAWRLFARLNNGAPSATGVGADYLAACDLSASTGSSVAAVAAARIREVLAGERAHVDLEYACPSLVEDRWFLMQVSAAPISGGAGAVVVHVDITTRKLLERSSAVRADHDGLTGLPNGASARDHLTARLRGGAAVAAIVADLDSLGSVNDRCGRHAGDELLVKVAGRIQRAVGAAFVARVGRDEFVVIGSGAGWNPAEASAVGEAIRAAVVQPFQLGAQAVSVGLSIGVATTDDADSADLLLEAARARVHLDELRRSDRRQRLSKIAALLPSPSTPEPGRAGAPEDPRPDAALIHQLRRSQATYEAVLGHSSDLVMFFDGDGTIDWVSPPVLKLFGVDATSLIGRNGFEIIHPDDQERVLGDFMTIPNLGDSVTSEFRILLGEQERWVEEIATNLLDQPDVCKIVANLRDVTDRKEAAEALLFQHTLLAAAGQAIIAADNDGRVLYWNDAAAVLYEWTPTEAMGARLADLVRLVDGSERLPGATGTVTGGPAAWNGELRVSTRSGREMPIMVTSRPVFNTAGQQVATTVVSSDITERRMAELALAHQANHDPLTGLANRRLLVEDLERSLDTSASAAWSTGVLYIDLDDFKTVNDRFGHVDGDEVIRAVAELIAGVMAPGDTVARLGGDEYLVCCNAVRSTGDLMDRAADVQAVLRAPFRNRRGTFTLTASIGAALAAPDTDAETLLRNADAAMYAVKEAGGAGAGMYDASLFAELQRRQQLTADIPVGLDHGEFRTYFQPEVELSTGTLTGFEALVRWHHPEHGTVQPDEFIELAEHSGLIGRLGRQVLTDACTALASWSEATPGRRLSVAVNVSPVQLADDDFPDDVRRAIEAAHVAPQDVCLEVTESTLMEPDVATHALRRLKAIGVSIAIDDFGTGYSSLSRLKRFPVDLLKIDRSFVAGLGSDPEDEVIVATVISMASSLGLTVVAEGIETATQLELLAQFGCKLGQGYLWSPAINSIEAAAHAAQTEPRQRARPSTPPQPAGRPST